MRHNDIFSMSTGDEFEGALVDMIHIAAKRSGCEDGFVNCAGTEMDKFEGTDAILNGIRLDFTHAFSHKDHMMVIDDAEMNLRCGTVKFGVRTGNSHGEFSQPVLVIGTDMTGRDIRQSLDGLVDDLTHLGGKFIDLIEDTFWGWVDNNPELAGELA